MTRPSDQPDDRRRRKAVPTRRTPKARHRGRAGKAVPAAGPLAGVASKLNPLDLDRAASMADEGGRAAAAVEREPGEPSRARAPGLPPRSRGRFAPVSLALFGLLVIVIAALRRRR